MWYASTSRSRATVTSGVAPARKTHSEQCAMANWGTCVKIKILRRVLLNRRVDLHAIDATPWLISTQVLGDRGVHARSAVGTNALPLGVPVEIEAVVEVEPGS